MDLPRVGPARQCRTSNDDLSTIPGPLQEYLCCIRGLEIGPPEYLCYARSAYPKIRSRKKGSKLSAFLCQLATIAKNEHWNLIHDAEEVVKNWDKDTRIDFYKPLFALNSLRLSDAHVLSVGDPTAQGSNLKVFDIEPDKYKTGWGLALDRVYDEIAKSLQDATTLLKAVLLSD